MADALHSFVFDGLPVRGAIVRLEEAWQEILARRAANVATGAWPDPVARLLGEMAAACALMQSSIKFNGALILQIYGDGPVKLAVAEAQADLALRATATVVGEVGSQDDFTALVNPGGQGRCAITLDPRERAPGQQPYQGVVPLGSGPAGGEGADGARLADVLAHYMRQSEQLDTRLVLAADERRAAGLLVQRLPVEGQALGENEDFNRIAVLAASLTAGELLALDVDTVLHRLFWEERLMRFRERSLRFACTCSRDRVAGMIRGLGRHEAQAILAERGEIEVGCDFCGQQYRFDAVDTEQLFAAPGDQPPVTQAVQ